MTTMTTVCLALRLALAAAGATTPARPAQDGQHRELAECEERAEAAAPGLAELAYESCMEERGL